MEIIINRNQHTKHHKIKSNIDIYSGDWSILNAIVLNKKMC